MKPKTDFLPFGTFSIESLRTDRNESGIFASIEGVVSGSWMIDSLITISPRHDYSHTSYGYSIYKSTPSDSLSREEIGGLMATIIRYLQDANKPQTSQMRL